MSFANFERSLACLRKLLKFATGPETHGRRNGMERERVRVGK